MHAVSHRMSSKKSMTFLVLIFGPSHFLLGCVTPRTFDSHSYPTARRADTVDVLHGERVPDPYRWLEDEKSPDTQAWLNAQDELTHRTLALLNPLKQELACEFEALFGVEDVSNLFPQRQRYFFTQREPGDNHAKVCVREGDDRATPHVVINPNEFSPDGTVALDWWYPSHDGALVAYGKSAGGTEKSTLYVRDVRTGQDLPDVIPFTQYCSVGWNHDGTGFFYNRCPDPSTVPPGEENFYIRVYFHRLGTGYQEDRYVWGEGRPKDEEPAPYPSSDERWMLLSTSRDPAKNDLYYARLEDGTPLTPIAQGLDALTSGDIVDGRLYIRTNYQAPRYRICATNLLQPEPEHWRDLVPEQAGVLDGYGIVDRKLVVHVTEDLRSRVLVHDLDGKLLEEVPLPGRGTITSYRGGTGTFTSFSGALDSPNLYFRYSSWVVAPATYCYNLRTHTLEKLHQADCPLDLGPYEGKQLWCTSKDGTRIPFFVVARKDLKLDGHNPTLEWGYGGFNIGFYPEFRASILPFVKRGGVWVYAAIRGGGEFGQAWHEGGRRANKQHSYDDFYAVAEELIRLGYTSPGRLACQGGSNGGLLIGVAITQRPDLYQASLAQVPLMDMLRFQKFGMGAQWVHEYGDPEIADEYAWVRAYSPYHHVQDGTNYPATLLVTAAGDNRVATAHAFKMTARLQAATSGTRPVLLRCERQAGHGAGKPLSMRIENLSEDWAFVMWQLGMAK